ncbi:OmpW/AlkL family protein [Phytohalomonas tamaricis]|uniref:OmpW/AlkL family protein n=1 Tax=Phytohalomonas tamaricis TaxID=2081032 RepID=UPI000D0B4F78|nr:OmpW family outer membrane protein [Phytohalomonas tamaricis]
MSKYAIAALLATCSLSTTHAWAYGQGDLYTRVGVAKVEPTGGGGQLAGGEVDVDSETGTAFTLGYRFLDQWGVELLAAPQRFKHDIHLSNGVDASTKHLPPTFTLQYYPLGGSAAQVQPYIGAGVNYTRFSGEEVDAAGLSLDMDDSWGWAAQAGVDLLINDHWAANLGVWYLDINSKATVKSGSAAVDSEHVDINPIIVMGGISYRF